MTLPTAERAAHAGEGAPRMGRAFLDVMALGVEVDGHTLLHDVSLSIQRGECFGLLGANGSGKSTLLRAITRPHLCARGQIMLEGQPLQSASDAQRARVGVVFQAPALEERLSVAENLRLGATLAGLRGSAAVAAVARGVTLAAIERGPDALVRTLSGGQRRRVDLARALMADPDLLLLDEPSAGLDEASYRRMWQVLDEARASRELTVLIATHRPDEAERCDRLAMIEGGRLVAVETPEELRLAAGDAWLVLESGEPDALVALLEPTLGPPLLRSGGALCWEMRDAAERLPQIVAALPPSLVRAAAVRRPGLAEAFLKRTGRDLQGRREGPA